MVKTKTGEVVAFENLELDRLSYGELRDIREQLKRDIMAVAEYIEDMEQCPDRDEEICRFQEAEYLREQDAMECETDW